jgi:MoaA/NifB/PqqE/SkfB family radical SAM enzyme
MGMQKFTGIVGAMPNLRRADISGGEPYCEQELPKMIAHLAGKGILCDVSTGGTAWREDVADEGKRAAAQGLFAIQISVPAITESVYDSVTATKGELLNLMENVGKFAMAFGEKARIVMTLCKENMGEIGNVSGLAKKYSLPLFVVPMMRAGGCSAIPLDVQELLRVKFFIESLRHGGARIHFSFSELGDSCPVFAKTYGLPKLEGSCMGDKAHAYIDAHGNVSGCTFLKGNGIQMEGLACK